MNSIETPQPLPLMVARHRLGEIVELVRYTNQQFLVTRNNRPMARLVGEPFMQALEELMKIEPSVAETLEILMNKEMMDALEQGRREVEARQLLPLSAVLDD